MTAIRHRDGRQPRLIFIMLTIAAARLSRRSNTRVQRVRLISDHDNRGKDNARHDVCGNDNAVTVSNPMPRRNVIQYSTIQVGFGCWEV